MLRLPARRDRKITPARKRGVTPPVTKGNMQVRVVTIAVLVAVAFVILSTRLWYLQVLAGEDYTHYAQATHTREVKIPAQRGVIYDRNGKVLANNVPGMNVTIIPDAISREKVKELAKILKTDVSSVLDRYDAAMDKVTGNPYGSMLVKENADRNAVTYVSERTQEFPSVTVTDDFVRNYPDGQLASHVLGYTGAVTADDLKQKPFKGLSNDSVVGKGGAEFYYEKELRGKPGEKKYSVDALGRTPAERRADGTRADGQPEVAPELVKPESTTDPVAGKDLTLTIDMNLQKDAESELDDAINRAQTEGYAGSGGAVIAMDPRNGEILAMASRPTFNPQLFVGGISGDAEAKTFKYLNSESANSPFTNRAIAGGYPAASTFKTFTGLAGLESGAITPSTTYTDPGGCWEPANTTGSCWLSWRQTYLGMGATHGTQNYPEALGDSNDKFFYQVSDWMWNKTNDPDQLPKFYEKFGFGSTTGVDLPGEAPGRVPTQEWEKWYAKQVGGVPGGVQWTIGDWVNMAIGQGDLLVSPMQLIQAYSAIENGGELVTPHVGKDIKDQGKVVEKISPKPEGKVDMSPQDREAALQGLKMVTGPDGTAAPAFENSKLSILGKSGTGEMEPKDPVNWFVGWADNQDQPLVVAVMVEQGGNHSEETAAPAVRRILEDYYGVKNSAPAPTSAAGAPTDSAAAAPSQ